MVQPRQDRGLTVELFLGLGQRLWRGVGIRADFFDRTDATFQTQVFGAVHSAHTPLADRRNNSIPSTQDGSGCKQASHSFFLLPFVKLRANSVTAVRMRFIISEKGDSVK